MPYNQIDAITRVREGLKEASRYVESDPDTAKEYVIEAIHTLNRIDDPESSSMLHRLINNLTIAYGCTLVDPAVTRAYIRGAIHELGQFVNDHNK